MLVAEFRHRRIPTLVLSSLACILAFWTAGLAAASESPLVGPPVLTLDRHRVVAVILRTKRLVPRANNGRALAYVRVNGVRSNPMLDGTSNSPCLQAPMYAGIGTKPRVGIAYRVSLFVDGHLAYSAQVRLRRATGDFGGWDANADRDPQARSLRCH